MQLIKSVNSWIAKFETLLLVVITLILVIGAFTQVILRNIFNTGIEGAEIVLRHLVLWIGFIGASLATRDEQHINVDLFSRIVGKKHKRIARIITDLVAVAVAFLLAYAGSQFVLSEYEFGTTLFGNIKAWYFQIIIPIGFMMIGLRFFLNLLYYVFNNSDEKK
ncbi:MAG: hypothetical protein Kow00108_10050 [Calditrichia bacterium]